MLETCNVSGIYIYLRDLELCLQITMMSFSENGTAAQWGLFHCCMVSIYGYVSSVFVISVKVGGVLFGSFLHDQSPARTLQSQNATRKWISSEFRR
ncbi:hypothetical protein M438DRAFT_212693 [Aureobasidium pullulans EXF-150]|uniref:Uncharacterized protein n=1 Tax=Aureobasidium pullulans EXF-150 TaxID=1043002 RepID=A0A074XG35_AURPU|nr:uncharacterized protein M438DRAFT_212693 [Aureobasidium pullulans EXF-150]KEQ84388.1 hypothetical protein M438DRAFT_212693 [Aureobasidium pullulans EXF-150]